MVDFFHKSEEDFIKSRQRDIEKTNLSFSRGYYLIRIDHTQMDKALYWHVYPNIETYLSFVSIVCNSSDTDLLSNLETRKLHMAENQPYVDIKYLISQGQPLSFAHFKCPFKSA